MSPVDPHPPTSPPFALTESDYTARAATVLARVEATIDTWLQDDDIDIDANRSGGLLELSLPDGSKIIINTQPPLKELWIAARAGGFHFKFDGTVWRDTRGGREFFELLSDCASRQSGRPLRFSA